jgi:capsular polysaccharide biosynthesis protein
MGQTVSMGQVLSALRRRLTTVLAAMLVGGVIAGSYAIFVIAVNPSFRATAVVTLITLPDNPLSTSGSQRVVNTATESQVVRSTEIAQRAAAIVRNSTADDLIAAVTVSSPLDSQVLQISFVASSARQAAIGANAFAQAYLAYRSESVDKQVRALSSTLGKQIKSLTSQQANAQAIAIGGASQIRRANATGTVHMLSSVLQQLREQQAQLDNASRTAGQQVGQAEIPTSSAGPSLLVMVIAGLAIGAVAGLALALIRDRMDGRVRGREQIEAQLGLRVLAEIPLSAGTYGRPSAAQTDAYRRLAAILTASPNVGGTSPLLLVAAGVEGRRDVPAKLSCAIAEQVGSTLLTCAPSALARNTATVRTGIWHPGLPEVESFGDETSLRRGNPLGGGASDAEMILIDGTNVEHASTPLVLTSIANSVLITARIGSTRLDEISDRVRELTSAGARIHGVVLLRAIRSPFPVGKREHKTLPIPGLPRTAGVSLTWSAEQAASLTAQPEAIAQTRLAAKFVRQPTGREK